MRHVAFRGFHQVGDEIMPPCELHVDIGPAALHRVPHLDQAVVGLEQQEQQHHRNNRNGYEGIRDFQGRSFSAFPAAERMEAFYGNRPNRRRFSLMSADQKSWPRIYANQPESLFVFSFIMKLFS
jgi:hypothetical protein